jgi:DNA-binding MarR family transcriptional regulator
VRRIAANIAEPLQHAYAFLLVALEEGRSVSDYAKRVGVTQAVMTRILFSLGSSSQGRAPGSASCNRR